MFYFHENSRMLQHESIGRSYNVLASIGAVYGDTGFVAHRTKQTRYKCLHILPRKADYLILDKFLRVFKRTFEWIFCFDEL